MKKQIFRFALIIVILLVSSCSEKKEGSLESKKIKTNSDKKTISPVHKETYRLKPSKETPTVYQWYCATCHGINGKGNGINSLEMPSRPINHTDAPLMSMKSDHDLFRAISKGGLVINRAPCMPPWEHTLNKEMIASLVGYLRELCQCEFSGVIR